MAQRKEIRSISAAGRTAPIAIAHRVRMNRALCPKRQAPVTRRQRTLPASQSMGLAEYAIDSD